MDWGKKKIAFLFFETRGVRVGVGVGVVLGSVRLSDLLFPILFVKGRKESVRSCARERKEDTYPPCQGTSERVEVLLERSFSF